MSWRATTIASLFLGCGSGMAMPARGQEAIDAGTLAEIRKELSELRAENRELRQRLDEISAAQSTVARAAPAPASAAPSTTAPTPGAQPPSPPPQMAEATPPPPGPLSHPLAAPVRYPTEAGDPYASAQSTQSYGAFSPGRGFKIADTPNAELNVSAYLLGRYINQLPADELSFVDHNGRTRPIDPRRDIQLQRMMVWLSGWAIDPKFHFQTIFWSVNSTNQVAIAGALTYHFNEAIEIGIGINRLPGSYTMMGSHPYWFAPDRVLADEFFRPGMTSGIWATGEVLPRLHYFAMLGDNLSQLGISAVKLTRHNAKGLALWWMPTTGEFGPRGGMGDSEYHTQLATRFGAHYVHSREDRFNQADISSPDNTQIRLSDSTLFFETGSLAPGVTIDEADFNLVAVNAGFKYRGWALHTEGYYRWLTSFDADGPLPLQTVKDKGFYVQGSYDILPRTLQLYTGTSQIYGQFGDSSEYFLGANWYPSKTRNLKVNAMVIRVIDSSVSSVFGYYVGGQDGVTLTASIDLLY